MCVHPQGCDPNNLGCPGERRLPFPSLWYDSPRTHLCNAGAREGHDHGHHVDSQLELQEFGYAVVDITAPHHCLDDAAEVVVCQDDVGGLLGHICASDALWRQRQEPGRAAGEVSGSIWPVLPLHSLS